MGKRGPKPLRYPVHGRMLTLAEIAKETGTTLGSICYHRHAYRRKYGKPPEMEAVYDHYAGIASGVIARHQGVKPKLWLCVDGRRRTVAQMAAQLGHSTAYFRLAMYRNRTTPVEEFNRRWEKRAAAEILAVCLEATKHDS